jgi:tRNA(Ile)-lysidine synthase
VEELAASLDAIGGFESRPLIAVAISGGPDSLALMLLADRWARQRGGVAWGVHVDHGLRPESSREAAVVSGWLQAENIPHAVLRWTGVKPASGIQEAARNARYRLLAEWCRAQGCLHLLTAHHRDDQVETYLMRRRARSGSDGLAGMAQIREIDGCRLLRPLLAVPKARLAAFLVAECRPFLSDPSNTNPVFERARWRLSGCRADTGMVEASVEISDFGRGRVERERGLDRLLAASVTLHAAGFAIIDPALFGEADPDTVERLFGRVAGCVGGAPYPARRERLARLCDGLRTAAASARTLGGCRFVPWRGRILVLRELAAANRPMLLPTTNAALWDRRFVAAPGVVARGDLILGYLGADAPAVEKRDGNLPRLVHPVLPALRDPHGRLVAVPHLGFWRCAAAGLPRLSFRPVNPLSAAGFTVV